MIRRRELLLGLGAFLLAAPALAGKKATARGGTKKQAAGGDYWRLNTEEGPVYVWVPPGYHRPTAGMVIYVHGYWTDVDRAWKEHRLPEQFRESRQNALFVVPAAPKDKEDGVKWKALGDLRGAIRRKGIRLPDGHIVAIGHSGAYRTVAQWVDHALISQITLLDGFYGQEDAFEEFIVTGKNAKRHRLVLVGVETAPRGEAFVRKHKGVRRIGLPEKYEDFTRAQRGARLLHIRAKAGHSELVTGGFILPLLLRLTPLRRL
ncbi:MAG: hypothetical protein KC620_07800 [Myxococcales bacterium]|nr:hypothetical protein [Myxococcales bacterium]